MTKFYTVCYGDPCVTYEMDSDLKREVTRLIMSKQAKQETRVHARDIKSDIALRKRTGSIKGQVVVVSSQGRPATECANILSEIFKCQVIQNKSLCYPYTRVGVVLNSLSSMSKSLSDVDVIIVVTSPNNHDCLSTRLSSEFSSDLIIEKVSQDDDNFVDSKTLLSSLDIEEVLSEDLEVSSGFM